MPRPVPVHTEPVMTRVSPEQLAALTAASVARNVSTAEIVRDAIDFYLNREPSPESSPELTPIGEGGRI